MKEELFKAKREDNGEWIQGSLLVLDDGSYRIATSCLVGDVENILTVCAYDVDPDTVCRYIGLTDKNGNKIWENDIVKNAEYENYKAIVQYGAFNCSCCHGVYGWTFESISGYSQICDIRIPNEVEVIGNIFDNKELLEGGEVNE